jgi:hypothetical protein
MEAKQEDNGNSETACWRQDATVEVFRIWPTFEQHLYVFSCLSLS